MLYIANVSTEYKIKGKQDYEVRVGSQNRYRTIGKFTHDAEESIASFFLKSAAAIEAYSPISDLKAAMMDMDSNKEQKPRLNLIALIISNISENYQQSGLQQYRVTRLCNNPDTNYQETLGEFEHDYDDGATECFLKAIKNIDPVIKNVNYKKIIEEVQNKNQPKKRKP